MLSSFFSSSFLFVYSEGLLVFVFVCGTEVINTLCLLPSPLLTSSSGRVMGSIVSLTVSGEHKIQYSVEHPVVTQESAPQTGERNKIS